MQPPGRSTRAGTGCAGAEAGGSPREEDAGRVQAWWSLDFTLNQSKVLRVLLKLGTATRFDHPSNHTPPPDYKQPAPHTFPLLGIYPCTPASPSTLLMARGP